MSYSVSIKQIILTCLALYILTDVFSGLLLFLLNNIGIGYIFYSRDILILFPILFYIFKSFKETRISKLEIFIIIFLILIVTWGYINTFNLFLILYGIKIFCSFWLGIILIHYFNPKEIITDSNTKKKN
jgi:DNA integrity scanning protein DisA with diadenylate cyclase activity